jgi:acyl carrier protein
MGMESLEILLGWEEAFGISFSDEEAASIRTPRMAMDLIETKVLMNSEASAKDLRVD